MNFTNKNIRLKKYLMKTINSFAHQYSRLVPFSILMTLRFDLVKNLRGMLSATSAIDRKHVARRKSGGTSSNQPKTVFISIRM